MSGLKVPYLKNDCEQGPFAVWLDFPSDSPAKVYFIAVEKKSLWTNSI